MLLVLVHVVYTFVYTEHGPLPVTICIYKSAEIEYDVHVYQPPWVPCAEYGNV